MIMATILLILIPLLLSLIILFSFYIFLPSLDAGNLDKDAIISEREKTFSIKKESKVKVSDKRAVVLCSCRKSFSTDRSRFNEAYTCYMIKNMSDTGTDCKYACIGHGDCARACAQKAIIIRNRTAVVTNLCCGCGKCAQVCPQKIITLVQKDKDSMILCANPDITSLTTCTHRRKDEKIEWIAKKDFKIWSYCYKILDRINNFIR